MTPTDDHQPTLRELLARELPSMLPFVRQQLGPELRCRESAADLLQSVCGDLLAEDVPFEYRDDERFRSWLRTVVVNKVRQRLRMLHSRKRGGAVGFVPIVSDLETPNDADSPSQFAVVQEELQRLEQALAAMPEHYRDAIVLTRLLGASRADAAHLMGRTEDSLRNVLTRALAMLSGLMDPGPE